MTLRDRAYLTEAMPTMIIWGTNDGVISSHHASLAHAAMPGSRLLMYDGAGHFPHHSDPERFVSDLEEFIATTQPAEHDPDGWRELLRRGGGPSVVLADDETLPLAAVEA